MTHNASSVIVVFDLDGVIFDTVSIAQANIRTRFPSITDDMIDELLSGNWHEEIKKIPVPHITETESEIAARQKAYGDAKAQAPLYDGMRELLESLRERGYTLALNTSAYDRFCIPLLERNGILGLFDFLGTAEVSKSKVEKFKLIQEKYGSKEKKIVFITDTLGDVKEAHDAGIQTIAVTWGGHTRVHLEKHPYSTVIAIVDTPAALKNLIERHLS